MIHPRPYSRGFLFTETKAIELFRGQTLQRGLKYTPLRKFVPISPTIHTITYK